MNSDNPKSQELLHNLYTLTKNDKLNWQESASEDSFIVSFPTYSVVLSQSNRSREKYSIDVINSTGRIVESIVIEDPTPPARFMDDPILPPTWFLEARELFELARRKALKTDEIMTDLLESLNELL